MSKRTVAGNRRDFFKITGAAGLLAGAVARSEEALASAIPVPRASLKRFTAGKYPKGPVMARGRVLGANDRILVGHIGVGNMGGAHNRDYQQHAKEWNTQSIAVCDPCAPRAESAKNRILKDDPEAAVVQVEKDYRKLLENRDIDAVVVATPEHWHCQIGVHAVEAGKHAYVQKPMSRYLDEGFQLHDAVKRTGKIVQIGSQGTSDPKYHVAREAVAAGKLGPIVNAQASYTRNSKRGEFNDDLQPGIGPDTLDWELWQGSAPKRPWDEEALKRFYRYRKYRDYSAGILGDLMPHKIHPLLLAMGGDAWPLKVHCVGTRYISTDREISDTVHVMAEMHGGWTFLFLGSTVNEHGITEEIRGSKATMYLAGQDPDIKPERPYAEEIEGGKLPVKGSGEGNDKHTRNWLEGIRGNKQPNCSVDLAIRAHALVCLAEISEMTNRAVHFDPARRAWKLA